MQRLEKSLKFTLSTALFAELVKLAERDGCSLAAVVRRLILDEVRQANPTRPGLRIVPRGRDR